MTGPPARTAPGARAAGLSLPTNALALIGSKVATMGLGFLLWIVAARLFDPVAVGVAAGVVAAMMLCTQLALLGVGSAVISHFPQHALRPAPLLDSAVTMVLLAGGAGALAFLSLAAVVFTELDAVSRSPSYALLFVCAAVLGTLGILLDQVSTALRRGDHALVRGVAFGSTAVAAVVAAGVAFGSSDPRPLLVPWVAAGVVACAIGFWQLRRTADGYRFVPSLDVTLARRLLATGLPNQALTLAERAPGLVLPIVVVELLSPAANAAWYAAWMMAWVVYIVPIQVGMTLFAEIAADPTATAALRRALRTAFAVGIPAALGVALLAHPLLSLLGPAYADAGATPLRILAAAVVPLTLVQGYYATCRGTGRLREAITAGWIAGIAAVAAAAVAGAASGLTAMAAAWLAVQLVAGAWAASRTARLRREPLPVRLPRRPDTTHQATPAAS